MDTEPCIEHSKMVTTVTIFMLRPARPEEGPAKELAVLSWFYDFAAVFHDRDSPIEGFELVKVLRRRPERLGLIPRAQDSEEIVQSHA